MKKWYRIPGLALALIFISIAFYFISKSHKASESFRTEKSKIAEILNFNDRLLSARDWLFTKEAWEEKKAQFDTTMVKADAHLVEAKSYGVYLLWACLAFLIVAVVIYRKRLYFGLTLALTVIAMALLGQGVMNPILEMSAFKEDLTIKFYVNADDIPYYDEAVEFLDGVAEYIGLADNAIEILKYIPKSEGWTDDLDDFVSGYQEIVLEGKTYLIENRDGQIGFDKVFPGKTYFYYQNKGIMEVIHLLWSTDNKPVAIAIGTFSIIVPLIKLLSTLLFLLLPINGGYRFRKFLSFIAKWSMADVFVVAAFLAYLSFSNMSPGVTMDAQVLFGLYYFMAYVVLSIFLGTLLNASIKERIKLKEKETNTDLNDLAQIDEK